jgi:hypothetical protein
MGTIFAQDEDQYLSDLDEIEKRACEKYISGNDKSDFHYSGDTTLNDSLMGNVIVVTGDLTVNTVIDGDVIVLFGSATILPEAVIKGNITCVNGRIRQEPESTVNGNQIETKARNLVRCETDEKYSSKDEGKDWRFDNMMDRYHRHYSTLPLRKIDKGVMMRYNRVQGFFLGLSIPAHISGKYNIVNLNGFGGYGFKEKKWRYQLGIDRWLFDQRDYRFELGAKIYDLTDSKDDWYLDPIENSLAAFLIHEDFHDFYHRRGFEVHASQNVTIYLKGSLTYRNEDFRSLEKNTDWALFGGKKKFRSNPLIDEGSIKSFIYALHLDTRDNIETARNGWLALLSAQFSYRDINSDFSFNQYMMELRRYQRLDRYERLDVRLKAVTSEGETPIQNLYQLGGVGTLNGFGFKEVRAEETSFGGNRLLLGNFEYNISPRIFHLDLGFLDDLRYIMFFDAGNVWSAPSEGSWRDGFSQLKWHDIKSDFGIAFSNWSENFRIAVARRTDSGDNPFVFYARINKPF